MRQIIVAIVFVASLTVSAQNIRVLDEIVAVVGENIVMSSDLEAEYAQAKKDMDVYEGDLKCEILNQLIIQKLYLHKAAVDSVYASEDRVNDEVERRIQYYASQIGGEKKLEQYLGKTIAEYKAQMRPKIEDQIVIPTINGLKKDNIEYKGFVFIGLIKVGDNPIVIEYNVRMGDPETEVVMPRLQTDLVALFAAMDNGTLIDANISYDTRSCATIMAVSGGYPGSYQKNKVITGLEAVNDTPNTLVFQAGTAVGQNAVVTSGGRVLAVTAYGENISEAVITASQRLQKIEFEGMNFRRDIGYEFEKK